MATLTPIEQAVLNFTADESENLEQIYRSFSLTSQTIRLEDAADAVLSLVQKGLLAPVAEGEQQPVSESIDPRLVWKSCFGVTSRGRETLAAAPEVPEWVTKRRSYFGVGEGMMPDIPFEVFKENRRDMSRKYSDNAADE
jgi:hypothetical protein